MTKDTPTDSQADEWLEILTDIQLEHYVRVHGRNLGQYQTEHDCSCGAKLYTDGNSVDTANLHVVQARHIASAIQAKLAKVGQAANLAERINLLQRLKQEADTPFQNVKQTIYVELDKAELQQRQALNERSE